MDLKISTYSDKIPFKSAQMNIVSIADNHGDLLSMPQLMKAIELNKKDIFEKSSEKSTSNVFAIAGDYFMNPLKTGFWTNPDFNNGDVQYNFLSKLLILKQFILPGIIAMMAGMNGFIKNLEEPL